MRCKVDDEYCSNDGKVRCKGLCSKHYNRFLAHGDPLVSKRNTSPRKPQDGEGWCGTCKSFKSLEQFSISNTNTTGITSICKSCASNRWKKQYVPGQEKFRSIKKKYNLTEEEYNEMFEKQNGACAICKQRKSLCVDHCHSSGRIRGLLCFGCNSSLGHMNDSIEALQNMIKYLEDNYV